MSWLNLEGKIAIVTGGACGIGKAVCEGLAEVGVNTVVADIDTEGASKTATELEKKYGGNHITATTNVTDKEEVNSTIQKALNAFSRVDILVNNAGILIPRLLVDPAGKEEITEQIWDKMVAINQKGYYLCAQAAARAMIKSGTGGVIINMTS